MCLACLVWKFVLCVQLLFEPLLGTIDIINKAVVTSYNNVQREADNYMTGSHAVGFQMDPVAVYGAIVLMAMS